MDITRFYNTKKRGMEKRSCYIQTIKATSLLLIVKNLIYKKNKLDVKLLLQFGTNFLEIEKCPNTIQELKPLITKN